MVERRLRWGVLGTSNIGRAAVIPAIQRSSNGKVIAVASRNEEKTKRLWDLSIDMTGVDPGI